VLILFGGGLSLATAVQTSGLAVWIGNQVGGLDALPTVLLVTLVIATVVFLTELTSNTATSATFLPILGGVALGIGKDPLLLMVPTALAATCAFMMPVATPPNAIVFGSGHVSIAQMVRAGIVLNAIAIVLILGVTYSLASWALGIST
jgi:solute carrier family 13 (sodium-dependent dicarboxylate transporter), member 2/3/5